MIRSHGSRLIGNADLEEFTNYANTQDGGNVKFSPSIAFGTFVTQHGSSVSAWSTGLNHFNHKNIFIESDKISPIDAICVVFNTGCMITGKWQYKDGETMETNGVFCRIQAGKLFDEDALQFVPVD